MRLGIASHAIRSAGRSLLLSFCAISCGSSSGAVPVPARDSGAAPTTGSVHIVTPDGYTVCARLDSAVDCFSCCGSFFPVAQQKLMNAAAQCTCTAPYCGPLSADPSGDDDGGATNDADPDGAALAQGPPDGAGGTEAGIGGGMPSAAYTTIPVALGACSPPMCSLQTAPSQLCLNCALSILAGAEGPPLCPESSAACNADPDCAPILACAAYCPTAVPD